MSDLLVTVQHFQHCQNDICEDILEQVRRSSSRFWCLRFFHQTLNRSDYVGHLSRAQDMQIYFHFDAITSLFMSVTYVATKKWDKLYIISCFSLSSQAWYFSFTNTASSPKNVGIVWRTPLNEQNAHWKETKSRFLISATVHNLLFRLFW